jgi:cytochrome c oxidase subunit 3
MTSTTPTAASGHAHEAGHQKNNLTSFIVFLCLESVSIPAFFSGYALLKTNALDWLPPGVEGLEWQMPLINSVLLVSCSGTISLAERAMSKGNLWGCRAFWLLTIALGSYFLVGQAIEWSGLQFGFTSGTFYLLIGFHGLHVATGVGLMMLMLIKLFIPENYEGSEQGVQATSLFWHFVDVI